MKPLPCVLAIALMSGVSLRAQTATLPPHLHCSSSDNVPNVNLSSFSFDAGTSTLTGKQATSASAQLPLDTTFPTLLQDVNTGVVFSSCRLTAYGTGGLTLYITMTNAHFTQVGVSGFDSLQSTLPQVSLAIAFSSVQVETAP